MKQLSSSHQCAFFSPNLCSANSGSSRFSGTQSVRTRSNQLRDGETARSSSETGANSRQGCRVFPHSSGNPRCRGACSLVSHRSVQQLREDLSSCSSCLVSIDRGRKRRKRMPANKSLLRQSESLACGTRRAIRSVGSSRFNRFNANGIAPPTTT